MLYVLFPRVKKQTNPVLLCAAKLAVIYFFAMKTIKIHKKVRNFEESVFTM